MPDSAAQPKISLLVPIYNVEKYLRQCLQSAQDQTLRDIEIICINDGSTDSSRQIIGEFMEADERFRVIDKPNSGYGASMNQGLDIARGEYIGILESDDFLDTDALQTMYDAAQANDAEVVKCDFFFYWSQPNERDERFGFVSADTAGLVDPYEFTDVFYLKPSIWSAIYRRDFLEANSIRFLETPGASYQDASFNFKVWASAHQVVLLDAAFLHYRQDNEASSVNSPGKVYCVCDEYDEMLRYLADRPDAKAILDPVIVKMRYDSYMWNYERLTEDLQREFITRMADDFRTEDTAGLTDYRIFEPEPWKIVDRKSIMEDPALFHLHKMSAAADASGKWSAFRRCLRTGGWPLVFQVIKGKLNHA